MAALLSSKPKDPACLRTVGRVLTTLVSSQLQLIRFVKSPHLSTYLNLVSTTLRTDMDVNCIKSLVRPLRRVLTRMESFEALASSSVLTTCAAIDATSPYFVTVMKTLFFLAYNSQGINILLSKNLLSPALLSVIQKKDELSSTEKRAVCQLAHHHTGSTILSDSGYLSNLLDWLKETVSSDSGIDLEDAALTDRVDFLGSVLSSVYCIRKVQGKFDWVVNRLILRRRCNDDAVLCEEDSCEVQSILSRFC